MLFAIVGIPLLLAFFSQSMPNETYPFHSWVQFQT